MTTKPLSGQKSLILYKPDMPLCSKKVLLDRVKKTGVFVAINLSKRERKINIVCAAEHKIHFNSLTKIF